MDWYTYNFFNSRLTAIEAALRGVMVAIQSMQKSEAKIMATAQQVIDKVAEVQGAEDSTIALLDSVHAMLVDVKAQLVNSGADASALDNVMTTLQSNKQRLGEAVERNPLPT